MSTDTTLAERLRSARYTGPLAALHKPRFWRAAVHEIIVELVEDYEIDDPQVIGERMARIDTNAVPLKLVDPVVCINPDYYDLDEPAERVEAARLAPDYWPAYADAPFARIDALENDPDLRALLAPSLHT